MPNDEVAGLYINLDSSDVRRGDRDVDKLGRTARSTSKSLASTGTASDKAGRQVKGLGKDARRASDSIGGINASSVLARAGIVALGFTAIRVLSNTSRLSREFGGAIAEVSTLIDDNAGAVRTLRKESLELASVYGASAASNAKAYYDVYSAGAKDATEANAKVTAANVLAVAGVTSLNSATNLLTSTDNAYAAWGLNVTAINDKIFSSVKNGKTTVDELAASISNISGTAALGVDLDIGLSAVAALTAIGTPTAQAGVQVRALVKAVATASPEMRKLAESVGITNFETANFEGFLEQAATALDGMGTEAERNAFAVEFLGGNIEGLNGFLGLVKLNADGFNKSLRDSRNSAGEAQKAYDKVAESLNQRYKVALEDIGASQIRIGTEVDKVLVPAFEGYASILGAVAENGDGAKVVLAGLAGATLPFLGGAVVAITGKLITMGTALAFATGGTSLLFAGAAALATSGYLLWAQDAEKTTDDLADALAEADTAARTFAKEGTKEAAEAFATASAKARELARDTRDLAIAELELVQTRIAANSAITNIGHVRQLTGSVEGDISEDEKAIAELQSEINRLGAVSAAAADEGDRLQIGISGIATASTKATPPTTGLNEALEKRRVLLLEIGKAGFGAPTEGINNQTDAWIENKIAVQAALAVQQEHADFLNGEYQGAIKDSVRASVDSLLDATDSWRDWGDAVVNIAKNTFASVIAEAASAKLLGALGPIGTGGIGGGGAGGAITGYGAALAGGGAGALTGLGVAGLVGAGIAASIAILGGERVKSRGLAVNFNEGDDLGGRTAHIRRTGLTGLIKGYNSRTETAFEGSEADAIRAYRDAIREGAQAIGDDFGKTFTNIGKIAGTTQDEVTRKATDAYLTQIDGVERFRVAGEALDVTLRKVIKDSDSVNDALRLAGAQFSDSVGGRAAALAFGGALTQNGGAEGLQGYIARLSPDKQAQFYRDQIEHEFSESGAGVRTIRQVRAASGSIEDLDAYIAAELAKIGTDGGNNRGSALALQIAEDLRKALELEAGDTSSGGGAQSFSGGAARRLDESQFATADDYRVAQAIARNTFGETDSEKANRLLEMANNKLTEIAKAGKDQVKELINAAALIRNA